MYRCLASSLIKQQQLVCPSYLSSQISFCVEKIGLWIPCEFISNSIKKNRRCTFKSCRRFVFPFYKRWLVYGHVASQVTWCITVPVYSNTEQLHSHPHPPSPPPTCRQLIATYYFIIFKGTVSRDGFGFLWHVWLVLSLNGGHGQFLNF
jgi:hypothetical protein